MKPFGCTVEVCKVQSIHYMSIKEQSKAQKCYIVNAHSTAAIYERMLQHKTYAKISM